VGVAIKVQPDIIHSMGHELSSYLSLLPKIDKRSIILIDEPFSVWPDKNGVSLSYNPNTPGNPKRYDEPSIVAFGFSQEGEVIFKTLEYPKGEMGHEEREPTAEETMALLRATIENSKDNPLINAGLRGKALDKLHEAERDPNIPWRQKAKLRNAYFNTTR